jgi:hypothetical protein
MLHNTRFRLRTFGGCSITVETSIVAASLESGCYAPDTTRVLCQPTTSTIVLSDGSSQVHSLPLSIGCCIDQPAYIRIRVLDNSCGPFDEENPLAQLPMLGFRSDPCIPCRTYYHASVDGVMYDGCSNPHYMGNDTISSEADCCDGVPAVPRSWGSIKSQYR